MAGHLPHEASPLRLYQHQKIQEQVAQVGWEDSHVFIGPGPVALALVVVDKHHHPAALDVDAAWPFGVTPGHGQDILRPERRRTDLECGKPVLEKSLHGIFVQPNGLGSITQLSRTLLQVDLSQVCMIQDMVEYGRSMSS